MELLKSVKYLPEIIHGESFQLVSNYVPTGDQPQAIQQLVEGIRKGERAQVLLGVTGSGKTFTMANVIAQINKPTLVLTHNKTLTAQLYGELQSFFPDNAVEYFVSYYDYYQPEAYIAVTDTYIEKDLQINELVDKLRLKATSTLLSGRQDIIIVASVSCIYGMGNPEDYKTGMIRIFRGQKLTQTQFLHALVSSLYNRTEGDFGRGSFRVKGDTVDINLPYSDFSYRVVFFGNEIENIETIETESGRRIKSTVGGRELDFMENAVIFPATLYVAPKEKLNLIIREIQDEMMAQAKYLDSEERPAEARRIMERVNFDLEMIRELGYCSGIENYSRFFDRRKPGTRPFCLLDYFPDDFLMFIDESHVTIPQVRGMWGGDRSRKQSLVNYGFRLPSAMDNRPLNFDEFESLTNQVVYVSATPADYELQMVDGVVVEQLVRPTGLLDPPIHVRPSVNQIDDLMEEIRRRIEADERTLVTTLTKRMSEELAAYFTRMLIKCRYIHSEVETLERVEILRDLRMGEYDVLIGVNLLREGLDLPEVSLVAILDADKEGFLRNMRSLTQTSGRAARNSNGTVIMYADKITDSMRQTIDETTRRRSIQMAYNEKHNITPTTVTKSKKDIFEARSILEVKGDAQAKFYIEPMEMSMAAEPIVAYASRSQLEKMIQTAEQNMKNASKDLDFVSAAQYRDEMVALKKQMAQKFE